MSLFAVVFNLLELMKSWKGNVPVVSTFEGILIPGCHIKLNLMKN